MKADLRAAGVSDDSLSALETVRRKEVVDAYVAGRTEGVQELLAQMKKSRRLEVYEVPPAAKRAREGKKGKPTSPGTLLSTVTDAALIASTCDRLWDCIRIGEGQRLSFSDDGTLQLTVTVASHEEIVCRFHFVGEYITYELTVWPRGIDFGSGGWPYGSYHITHEASASLKKEGQQGGRANAGERAPEIARP